MKPLREWIEGERINFPNLLPKRTCDFEAGHQVGWLDAMEYVLHELKNREDAEREQVNENVNALDSLAGEVLDEKEGNPDDA